MLKHQAILSLGSNMGDKKSYLEAACNLLEQVGVFEKISSIYQTAAWGNTRQNDFYNMAALFKTDCTPDELMQRILETELRMGRKRLNKWEPRIIDIDIILFDDMVIQSEILIIPHPQMQLRRFVLEPICEITPDWIHPTLKKSVKNLLEECNDDLKVQKLVIN